jgi:hypothetical protein
MQKTLGMKLTTPGVRVQKEKDIAIQKSFLFVRNPITRGNSISGQWQVSWLTA